MPPLAAATRQVIAIGDVVRGGGAAFVAIKCDPPSGRLGLATEYFTDGSPIVEFEKIQFSAWGESEVSTERLFSEYLSSYFKGECAAYGAACSRTRLLYCNQAFRIKDLCFQVEATGPAGLGVVTSRTEIFAVWDHTPEFERVQIIPFQDASKPRQRVVARRTARPPAS